MTDDKKQQAKNGNGPDNLLGGKMMDAIQSGGKIYIHEPDVREAVNAALATNAQRNERITTLERELAEFMAKDVTAGARIYNLERELAEVRRCNAELGISTVEAMGGGGWISVKDRLPPKWETVIVEGGVGYYWDECNGWYTLTGFNQPGKPIQWEVTHWMPLPKLVGIVPLSR